MTCTNPVDFVSKYQSSERRELFRGRRAGEKKYKKSLDYLVIPKVSECSKIMGDVMD